jgi:hypothetical protein
MKQINCYVMLLYSNIFFGLLFGCEEKKSVLLVPGLMNGYGQKFESEYADLFKFIKAATPSYKNTDFGGIHCQHALQSTHNIQNFWQQKTEEKIIYATSQGTITTLFWLAQLNKNTAYKPPQYVILEGPIASINDTIVHTMAHASLGPLENYKYTSFFLTCLPYAYCLLPYAAHCMTFPNYMPNATQPIEVIPDLPKETTFILLCGKDDPIVPSYHAGALYFALKNNGFNAHLVETDTTWHCDLFNILSDNDKNDIIMTIQDDFCILPQISHGRYKEQYTKLMQQDDFIKNGGLYKITAAAAALGTATYLFYKKYKDILSYLEGSTT